MATIQVIIDGPRDYVIKVDGTGSDVNVVIVDPTLLNPKCTRVRLRNLKSSLAPAGTADLTWDASAPVSLLHLYGGNDVDYDFSDTMGIPNNAGAGNTGKVLLSTSANPFTMYMRFLKKDPVPS